jgi:hypothetical protein
MGDFETSAGMLGLKAGMFSLVTMPTNSQQGVETGT